ncbi:DUF3830 family protein [Gluconacetobacter sp. Hr-1-5]|uniref:DUF3830 family protein n=1 Tax=Gluconacetobacter sp. Hr-1-5 TaxID=3395370 RepID=UPI003B52857A
MPRSIRLRESRSHLDVQVDLLDDLAPENAELLWQIAGIARAHEAIHAMWTGPEISCPIFGSALPDPERTLNIPLENATSYPAAGEIATVFARRGTWKGMPEADFFDIGLFYGDGARLLMPMGWIMGSVCARIAPADLADFQQACRTIRRQGACELTFVRNA